ncbi:hypothetical protein [uncultured Bradyrhizobium sp.]|uniref:hypothetical protein n=1 Tax=uncultured Bradyrhizobium sp. TaxID=199684 RepID=UPI0035C996EC
MDFLETARRRGDLQQRRIAGLDLEIFNALARGYEKSPPCRRRTRNLGCHHLRRRRSTTADLIDDVAGHFLKLMAVFFE